MGTPWSPIEGPGRWSPKDREMISMIPMIPMGLHVGPEPTLPTPPHHGEVTHSLAAVGVQHFLQRKPGPNFSVLRHASKPPPIGPQNGCYSMLGRRCNKVAWVGRTRGQDGLHRRLAVCKGFVPGSLLPCPPRDICPVLRWTYAPHACVLLRSSML